MTVQPVPAPETQRELITLAETGVLIDMAGRPLQRRQCETCDGMTMGETCPASLECPQCHTTRRRCLRPSGHEAQFWHAAREQAALDVDSAREEAGDPTLPAPWPTRNSKDSRNSNAKSVPGRPGDST